MKLLRKRKRQKKKRGSWRRHRRRKEIRQLLDSARSRRPGQLKNRLNHQTSDQVMPTNLMLVVIPKRAHLLARKVREVHQVMVQPRTVASAS